MPLNAGKCWEMLENAGKCWNGGNEKLNAGKFFPDVVGALLDGGSYCR